MTRKRSDPGAIGRAVRRAVRSVIEFLRRLVWAARHVRTGGQSTRTAAVRRAAQTQRCSACRQPIPTSGDWRDHLEEAHPEWVDQPADHDDPQGRDDND